MSVPRARRSRIESPFGRSSARNTTKNTVSQANGDSEGSRTSKQWTEPDLAPPRPSFAEAGIERHGVLQNMAALGALPTAKVMKAAATAGFAGGRGAGRKGTPAASTPGESNATPEPTNTPSRPASSPTNAGDSPVPVAISAAATEMPAASSPRPAVEPAVAPKPFLVDIPTPTPPPALQTSPVFYPTYMSRAIPQVVPQPAPRRWVPPTTAEQQRRGQGVFAISRPQPVQYQAAPPVPPPIMYLSQQPFRQPNGDVITLEYTDKVVTSAVQDAIEQEKWPTAYALRTLYDDQRKNPRMVQLINSIFTSKANVDEITQFRAVMKHKKREGKKNGVAEYYFIGLPGTSKPGIDPHSSSVNVQTSTYSTPSVRSGSMAGTVSDTQARRSSFAFSSVSGSPHKEPEQHISKKHKGNHFTSSNFEMNGTSNIENGVKDKTPRKQSYHEQDNGVSHSGGRRPSISSSSSLSSVDEQVLDGGDFPSTGESGSIPRDSEISTAGLGGLGLGLNLGGAFAASTQAHNDPTPYANTKNSASAGTLVQSEARNQPGPITAPTSKGPKTYTFSTVTTSSPSFSSSTNNNANAANSGHRPPISHHAHPTSIVNNSMAPAALLPSAQISSTIFQPPPSIVLKTKKDLNKTSARASLDENDSTKVRLKRAARKVTDLNTSTDESFVRESPLPLLAEFEPGSDEKEPIARKRATKLRLLNNNKKLKITRQTSIGYDSDNLSSPTALGFAINIAPDSLPVSRAGTPNTLNRPTRKVKKGTGVLRVKTSPMKKKGSTLAGIPRASGQRNSPVGNGPSFNQDENDDYCSSCGGNGTLVCCDGCARAFHYLCIDPPISAHELPDSAWFCNVCDSRDSIPELDDEIGSFSPLLAVMSRSNTSAFRLPEDIKVYFENVKTGADGEYEEPVAPKTAKNRGGYDEAPDYFKLKDAKGKTILCHHCHGAASAPDRAIIPCTFCGLNWHLDCLDVPLAKEPALGRSFRCPAHVDDILAVIPGNLGPAHRRRKIKGAPAIEPGTQPAIRRVTKNSGEIEIENDPTDDEEERGFYEQREYGRTYKLSELGIKLDFISQVRQNTGGGYAPSRLASHKPVPAPPRATQGWEERSIQERQAALVLSALRVCAPEASNLNLLIDALLTQASPAVIALIAQADAGKVANKDMGGERERNVWVALKAFIEGKLDAPTAQSTAQAEQVATPASTTAEKANDSVPEGDDDDADMLL